MQNTKLIHHFKVLKESEYREFAIFLKSPFFNRNERILKLFNYIRKFKNDLSSIKLDKEVVFKKVFPRGEVFEDWKMRELMSDLTMLIEKYFVWKETEDNPVEYKTMLIKSLDRRRGDKFFFRYASSMLESLEDMPLKDMNNHFQQLQLNRMIYYHSETSKYSRKGAELYLSSLMNNIDAHYIMTKLRYECEATAWERLRGTSFGGLLSGDFVVKLSSDSVEENILMKIYSMIRRIFKSQEYKLYPIIKEDALKILDGITKQEASDLMGLLINISSIASGNHPRKEMLDLYKIAIRKELFIDNGYFAIEHFNNIVSLGASEVEYKWTKSFIEEYAANLPSSGDKKENITTLYDAQLLYAQGEHNDVLYKLQQLEFDDISYGIRHYQLIIRSLYELRDISVHDKCNSFRQYLFRKQKQELISIIYRESNHNFTKIVDKLADTWETFRADIKAIETMINETENLELREWLLNKVARENKEGPAT